MSLSDEQLRALVRETIQRRVGGPQAPAAPSIDRAHPSHVMLAIAAGGDGDGACLIEPSVRCTHCGYCLSLGH